MQRLNIWDKRTLNLMDKAIKEGIVATEKEFCKKIGFPFKNLPHVKAGRTGFRIKHLCKAALLTNTSLNWICGIDKKLS